MTDVRLLPMVCHRLLNVAVEPAHPRKIKEGDEDKQRPEALPRDG